MTGPRATQDRLLDLERTQAPVEEQIQQAALLAGFAPISPNLSHAGNETTIYLRGGGVLHGRQEYVLRWLWKKLQVQPIRCYSHSWSLFALLVGSVPIRNVARILSERNLVVLLRQVVEEAVERRLDSPSKLVEKGVGDDSSDTASASPTQHKADGTVSKKGQRDGQPAQGARRGHHESDALIKAVCDAVQALLRFAQPGPSPADPFIWEHVKSAIRATGEEAAGLLRGWLKLCQGAGAVGRMDLGHDVLSPLIEIWNLRARGDEDATHFAQYCLLPCLSVLCTDGLLPRPKAQVEQLLAQHVIVPLKSTFASSIAIDVTPLGTLMRESVSEKPLYAPVLFDVAIRCLQPRGQRPRRSEDSAWLQWAFSILDESMTASSSEFPVAAMVQMLQISARHKVTLDVPFLQRITSEYGLPADDTSWNIIAATIELDPNIFLVPKAPNDLCRELLSRITNACAEPSWPDMADQVVGSILVPLVDAFAEARQLGVFIRLWYEQLFAFESLRQSGLMDFTFYGAWEDEALQSKLADVLEASLTDQQIVETVGWLEERITECEAAVLVLMEVIAGALSHADTIAVVSPKFPHLSTGIFNLNLRYRPRIWRLARAFLQWPIIEGINRSEMDIHLSDRLRDVMTSLQSNSDSFLSLEMLEIFRYLCALWSSGLSGEAAISVLNDQINGLAIVVSRLAQEIKTGQASGETRWGSKIVSIERDFGWFACAYIYCVLVEHPKVLELFPELPNSVGSNLLRDIVWIASATTSFTADHCPSTWLKINHDALPGIWKTMLQDEYSLNNPKITRQIMDAMLDCKSHQDNPIVNSSACNGFVIRCLHQLPLEVFSKPDRVAIMKAWQPEPQHPPQEDAAILSHCMAPLNPAVLSLKAKMMQRPTLYDGIAFQDLLDLSQQIVSQGRDPHLLTPIFGTLVHHTLNQILNTLTHPPHLAYFHSTIQTLRTWLQENHRPKKPPPFTLTHLFQTLLMVLSTRLPLLTSLGLLNNQSFLELKESTIQVLLSTLLLRFEKPEKLRGKRCLSLTAAMDALDVLMTEKEEGEKVRRPFLGGEKEARGVLGVLGEVNPLLGRRLEGFLVGHYFEFLREGGGEWMDGDVNSTRGREMILWKSGAVARRLGGVERVRLGVDLVEGSVGPHVLDRLLALRHVIDSCEDLTPPNTSPPSPTLSSIFTLLSARLRRSNGVREFSLVSEIMEMMLRSKPRSITQYNIDDTLSTITTLCTRSAPSLRASRCGSIYSRLVRLVHTILTCHRLKIQGHLHLVIQALISLLRCLFIPSAAGGLKSSHAGSAPPLPPWLSPPTSKWDETAQLTAHHSQSYSRLLTLLCDPTPSSTSRSSQPSLHSSTKLAKHNAGLHAGPVLLAYIRWTLDMSLSMRREVREALVPGWWALLEAVGQPGRRLVGEQMDASGRVVLSGLVRDWRRFGRWEG